ncbi:MAG: TrmH family RNA methyltransferase [Crocinitomicaceae bacterium]|nr:TrmH family RNA methyltransferase [Crocinitomicaceae bacterium]
MSNRKLKLQELNRLSADEFKKSEKTPIIIVLDNIRSLNNVGSVFRSADAFRIEKIYLCGITAQPPHREIHKTAIGATETVEWEYAEDVLSVVESLKDEYITLAIEQAKDSIMLNDYNINSSKKYAIVMGNEVEGVKQEVVDAVDNVIEVPQIGTKHSLNISVCTGVVLWEFFKNL